MDGSLPRCRAALEEGIRRGLHLGGQLHVSRHGETVGSLAVGESRPGVPMTPETLMLWLSATKPVTAVAVAQLWERGLLSLDDPIARHLPEFAAGGKGAITVRHALTHTGGFRILRFGWPEAPWEEILARICASRLEPRWEPGEKAGYHVASSWFVLGELVRRLDGRHPSRYVREEIFLPLGMDDCWLGMPVDRLAAYGDRLAVVFDTAAEPPREHPWHQGAWVTGCSPGGNGWGPIHQLARLYEMLLGGGERDGARLLSPQTVDAMLARQRVGLYDHTFGTIMDWGLGVIPNSLPVWGAERDEDEATEPPEAAELPYHYGRHASRRAVGHSGYRSSTAFCDPRHGLAVALAVNGTPSEADHVARFRHLTEAVYEDLGLA